MTTPPSQLPPTELPGTTAALRDQVRDLQGECDRYVGIIGKLTEALTECRGQAAKLNHALKRYGTHAFTCRSEHGRYPKLCSCGLHEVLK